MSCSTIHEHRKRIWKTYKGGIRVPRKFTFEKREQRSVVISSLLTRRNAVLMSDEQWVLHHNKKTKKRNVYHIMRASTNIKARSSTTKVFVLCLVKRGRYCLLRATETYNGDQCRCPKNLTV